jgi:hypothetical protein
MRHGYYFLVIRMPTTATAMAQQHQNAIEALAEHWQSPRDVIEAMYWNEFARIEPGARITQYLPLVTSRRVRDLLRRRSRAH